MNLDELDDLIVELWNYLEPIKRQCGFLRLRLSVMRLRVALAMVMLGDVPAQAERVRRMINPYAGGKQ